jgi:hypothetical protein
LTRGLDGGNCGWERAEERYDGESVFSSSAINCDWRCVAVFSKIPASRVLAVA